MNIKFPFGKYKGQTLDEVASTTEGLLYLDSIIDFMKTQGLNFVYFDFYEDLKKYLKDPNIQKEIEEAIE